MADAPAFRWVKVKNRNAIRIWADELSHPKFAFNLLEIVQSKSELKVPIDKLSLFENEENQVAVPADCPMDQISGGKEFSTPLYVSYPDACSDASSSAQAVPFDISKMCEIFVKMHELQEKMRQDMDWMMQRQKMLEERIERAEERVVPASSSSWDADWHERVCYHYDLYGCIILSQIFPETHEWFCQHFPNSYFAFIVSGHLYRKKEVRTCEALDIDFDIPNFKDAMEILKEHPRNGLPLLKHFEILYQDGHMTFFPCAEENPLEQEPNTIRVKIHVARAFHETFLQWVHAKTDVRENPKKKWCVHSVVPVEDERGTIAYQKRIKLRELHEKVIKICPQPYMPSILMQARVAHEHRLARS